MKMTDIKWRNIFKGMAMGMVETVPGVSSSTIAMVLGIYENLILAISNITTKRYRKSLLFLLPIVIGILIGAVFSIVAVKYFLEKLPSPDLLFVYRFNRWDAAVYLEKWSLVTYW